MRMQIPCEGSNSDVFGQEEPIQTVRFSVCEKTELLMQTTITESGEERLSVPADQPLVRLAHTHPERKKLVNDRSRNPLPRSLGARR